MKTRIILATLLATALPGAVQDETIKLKVSHFLPPMSNFQQTVLKPWCEALQKDSDGRLQCEIYPAMQMGGTPPQLLGHVRDGIADIVWTSPSYTAGLFPSIEAIELPFMVPGTGVGGSRAMWEFYETHAQKEFSRYKVLAISSGSGMVLNTMKAAVTTLEGFDGLKLRSVSRISADMLSALGSAPVSMPVSQVTESVSRGVADGAIAPWDLVNAIKLDEITRFHAEFPPGKPALLAVSMAMLMNKQKYEALPAELKAVIDKNSGPALVDRFGRSWDESNAGSRKRAETMGNTIAQISDAEYEKMRDAVKGVEAEWIKEVKSKGLDGAELISAARKIGEKHLGE